jgi:hypothetical protein
MSHGTDSAADVDTSGVRRVAGIGVGISLVVMAGCGGGGRDVTLPQACIQGPGPVLKALARAPARVAVQGTPISGCFSREATGDDEQIVGTNLLAAAQELGDRARRGDATAALQLGYLIGAAERGAKRTGVANELIRRLQDETTVPRATRDAYTRGHSAGTSQG